MCDKSLLSEDTETEKANVLCIVFLNASDEVYFLKDLLMLLSL